MSEETDQALASKPTEEPADQPATDGDDKPLFSPSSRMGDVGLTVFGIVWAIAVIAVGMWVQA